MAFAEQGLPVRPLPGQVQPETEQPVANGEGKPADEKEDEEGIWSSLVHMLTGSKKN
jgi:hypothetical protein